MTTAARLKVSRGGTQVMRDAVMLKARGVRLYWRAADSRLLHGFNSFHDSLRAPGKAVDLAHAGLRLARFVLVEGDIDAAQHGGQRHTGLAPGVDKRPIHRGEQQDGATAALEVLFDFREVVYVVLHCPRYGLLAQISAHFEVSKRCPCIRSTIDSMPTGEIAEESAGAGLPHPCDPQT